jgi:competence ComEA-like helix-hairpin-helix protein
MTPRHVQLGALAAAIACAAAASWSLATLGDGVRREVVIPRHRVNLATASVDEIALLPGVGPSLAGRIVAERARGGGFTTVDELARVAGVGAATLEGLRVEVHAEAHVDR